MHSGSLLCAADHHRQVGKVLDTGYSNFADVSSTGIQLTAMHVCHAMIKFADIYIIYIYIYYIQCHAYYTQLHVLQTWWNKKVSE